MIGNITKGNDFGKLLKYLLEKEKASLVSSNMYGKNSRSLAAEFNLSLALRPNIKRAVYHVSLSLDPREKLTNRQWDELARKYLEGMGFVDSQFVTVKHRDRQHSHLHIVTSRIDLNGNVINTYNDYFRSQKVIRPLEREFNLKQLHCSWELDRHQQTRQEIELLNQTWDNSVRRHLQNTIDEIVDYQSPLTVQQLLKELETRQISHQVHYADNGAVRGLSYSYNGINYSGSSLGVAYTFNGLQKHREVSCDNSVEREIYNTCTIAPDTPAATTELLQSREASQQFIEYLKQPRSHRETAKRIIAERERLEKEIAKQQLAQPDLKEKEIAFPKLETKSDFTSDLFEELELVTRRPELPENPAQVNSRIEQGMDDALQQQKLAQKAEWERIARAIEYQNHILRIEQAERQRKAKKAAEKEKQRQQEKLREIVALTPVFTYAIEYTQFIGVEIKDAVCKQSINFTLSKILGGQIDDGLCLETENYIITVKNNPQSNYDLDPRQHLNNGTSCQNLTIERKGSRINDEILSINFLDYEKPDHDNIHIVHNALTDDDKQQLQSLQQPVERIFAEHQKAIDDAVAAVKQAKVDRQLEAQSFSGDLEDLKKAVILILQEKGHRGKKVEIGYQSDDLFMGWTQTYNPNDRKLHHHLKVYRHDPNEVVENKLILHWQAKSSNTCYKVSDPNWQIKNADLCELDAKKLKDIHYPIAREILAQRFMHQVYLVALSCGERGYGSKSATYDGKQYKVVIDSESVKVWSKLDDRGLIFECGNNSKRDRFKNAAVNKFEEKDYKWFEITNQKINKIQKEHDLQRHYQKQRQKQRQREKGGGGLEL